MKKLIWLCVLSIPSFSFAFIEPMTIVDRNQKTEKVDYKRLTFLVEVLHSYKPLLKLDCQVRVREMNQMRKFSDGPKLVEMMALEFEGIVNGLPMQKAYFGVGSEMRAVKKYSADAGLVEEITLQSEDRLNSRFIFQHDGAGNIVWMSFEDDVKTAPCRLK